jgi:hypothetical protein
MNGESELTREKEDLDEMRKAVAEWLIAQNAETPELTTEDVIVSHFLRRAGVAGFTCHIEEIVDEGSRAYEVRWTHHRSSFVGFKQPPLQKTPEDALVAGCAALLENDWCRGRLG